MLPCAWISRIVSWYISNFSEVYFRKVGEARRMEHVKALLALKSIGQSAMQLAVNSESEASGFKDTTQMRTDCTPGLLGC